MNPLITSLGISFSSSGRTWSRLASIGLLSALPSLAQQVNVCVEFGGSGIPPAEQAGFLDTVQAYYTAAGLGPGDAQAVVFFNASAPPADGCNITMSFECKATSCYFGTSDKRTHTGIVNLYGYTFSPWTCDGIDRLTCLYPGDPARKRQAMAETLAHEVGHTLCAVHECTGGGMKNTDTGPAACSGAAPSLMTVGSCADCAHRGIAPPAAGSRPLSATSIAQITAGVIRLASSDVSWDLDAHFDDGIIMLAQGKTYLGSTNLPPENRIQEDALITFSYHILSGDQRLFEFGWLNSSNQFVEPLPVAANPDQLLEAKGGTFLHFALRGRPNCPFEGQIYGLKAYGKVTLQGTLLPASSSSTFGIGGQYGTQARIDFNVQSNRFSVLLDTGDWSADNGFYPTPPVAGSVTLVSTGSVWKYLANGSDQGTAWRALNFNDSSWSTGLAELGYGDGGEQTIINGGPATNRFITSYFRGRFVPPLPLCTNLLLRLRRDDGAVVYLNGTEVVRSHMPSGPIAFNTPASSPAVDDAEEKAFFEYYVPLGLLSPGQTNVVAVELHQASTNDPDASFDLELVGNVYPENRPPVVILSPPPVNGSITTNDPVQTGRLFRDTIAQTCAQTKSCPNTNDAILRHFHLHSYTNSTGADVCVTFNLTSACGATLAYMVAYLGTFDPSNLCANYLGDAGVSGSSSFSANIPAGATYQVAVSEQNSNSGCSSYTLSALPCPDPSPTDIVRYDQGQNINIPLRDGNVFDVDGTVTKVEFYASGALLGSDAVRPFGIIWSNPPVGTYGLTAVAYDNSGQTTVSTDPVYVAVLSNQPPVVVITGPTNGSTLAAPASFTVRASASDPTPGGSIANVQFLLNGASLGTDATAPYTASTPALGLGNYVLTAIATDNQGARSTSAPVNVSVSYLQPIFSTSFDTLPGNASLLVAGRLDSGLLKLTDDGVRSTNGGYLITLPAISNYLSFQASWRSRVGGATQAGEVIQNGSGGADGYSFSVGTNLSTNSLSEEGTGNGLIVSVDTYNNNINDNAPGIDIKWQGQSVAFSLIYPGNPTNSKAFLRKNQFVDASVEITPSGTVTFMYDGVLISAELPNFTGLQANTILFGARTGGADDNHWIDELNIQGSTQPMPANMVLADVSVTGDVNGQPLRARAFGSGSFSNGVLTADWSFTSVPTGYDPYALLSEGLVSMGNVLAVQHGSAVNLQTAVKGAYSIQGITTFPDLLSKYAIHIAQRIYCSTQQFSGTVTISGSVALPPLSGYILGPIHWNPVPGTNQIVARWLQYLLQANGGAPIRAESVALYTPTDTNIFLSISNLQRFIHQPIVVGCYGRWLPPYLPGLPLGARIASQNDVYPSAALNAVLNAPLGNSVLFRQPSSLFVSNIGPSGQDGVSLALDEAQFVDMDLQPVSLAASNSSFLVEAVGSFNGAPGSYLGSASLTRSGTNVQVRANFDPIGATLARVEVYNNGIFVGSNTVPTGLLGNLAGTISVGGCGKLPTFPWPPRPPCYWLHGPIPWTFTSVGAPPLIGNELRILAANAIGSIQNLSSFNIKAANIGGQLVISNQVLVDPAQTSSTPSFEYVHHVLINGQAGVATASGQFGPNGVLTFDGKIDHYIPGYKRWPVSWLTLASFSGCPPWAVGVDNGVNVLALTRGNLGHQVQVHATDNYANLNTLIYVRRSYQGSDKIVAHIFSQGTANYPEMAGIVSPLVYSQGPTFGADTGFTETGTKQLIAVDGSITPHSFTANYLNSDPMPASISQQQRTTIMQLTSESADHLNVSMRIQGLVRPISAVSLDPSKMLIQYTHNFYVNGQFGSATALGLADRTLGQLVSHARINDYVLGYKPWPYSPVTLQLMSIVSTIAKEIQPAQNLYTLTAGNLGHTIDVHTLDQFADIDAAIQVVRRGDAIVANVDSSGLADYPEGPASMSSPMQLVQTPNAGGGFTETITKHLIAGDGTPIESHVTAVYSGVTLSNAQVRNVNVSVLAESADQKDVDLQFNATVMSRYAPTTIVNVAVGLSTIANNYNKGGNTLNEVIPHPADFTRIYKWTGIGYALYEYDPDLPGWAPDGNATLAPGEGALIQSMVSQIIVFTGQIPTPGPLPRPVAAATRLVGCRAPAASNFEEVMGFPPAVGDQVLQYTTINTIPPGASSTNTYTATGWVPSEPILDPAKAEFVRLVATPSANVFGLTQTPLGNANLTVQSNQLVVSNIGSSGQDGVSIDLGQAQFGTVTFDQINPSLMPTGAYVNMRVIGTVNNVKNSLLGTVRATAVGPNVEYWCDYGPIGAVAATAVVYDGSNVVAQVRDLIGTVARVPGPIICDRWDPFWPMGGRPWALIDFPSRPLITLIGGPTVAGTRLVVIPQPTLYSAEAAGPRPHPWDPQPEPWGPQPVPWWPQSTVWGLPQLPYPCTSFPCFGPQPLPWQIDNISRLEVLGSQVGQFKIIAEEVGLFHQAHQAVGAAQLNAQGLSLNVQNLPASGVNGVDIALAAPPGGVANHVSVELNPQPLPPVAAPGAFLEISARGTLVGGPSNQFLGSLTVQKVAGGSLNITPNYNPIGSTRQRVEVWGNGVLLNTSFVSNTVAASVPSWPGGCGKEGPPIFNPPGPWILCIVADWPIQIPFSLPGGGPIIFGDQLRVLADNPPTGLDYLTSFNLHAGGGVTNLQITAEHSGQSGLWFQGLAHTRVGTSSMSISNGQLVVSGLNSGSNGVSLYMGDAGHGIVSLDRLDANSLPTGANVQMRTFGTVRGIPNTLIGTLRATDVGTSIQYWCDYSPIGAVAADALVYDGSNVVARINDIVGPVATIPGQVVCDRWDPVWQMDPWIFWALIEFPDRPTITLTGGQPVIGDRLVVVPKAVLGPIWPRPCLPTISAVSRIDVLGTQVGTLRIAKEEVGAFHQRNHAIGQARLFGVDDDLRLNNLVSSANNPDGVELALTDSDRFSVMWRPLAPVTPAPTGSVLVASARGAFGGGPEQLLGQVSIIDSGYSKQIYPDYSAISSFSQRIEILRDGQIIAATNGNFGLAANVVDWPVGCGKTGPPWYPPILCFWWRWWPETPIDLGGFGTKYMGDEIRILSENLQVPLDYMSAFSLQAAGIREINFVSEIAGRKDIKFGGLSQTRLGAAQVAVAPNGSLLVSNLGSSGQDGVRIGLGDAEYNIVRFDPGSAADLPTGAFMRISSVGMLNGVEEQLLWSIKTEDVGTNFGLSFDATPLKPASVRLEARLNNVVVDSLLFTPPPPTNLIIVRYPVDGCWIDPFWPMPPENWAILQLMNPGPVTLLGHSPVMADRIVLATLGPQASVGSLSATLMQGNVPNLEIFDVALGMFGLEHRAAGQAQLTGLNGSVRVGNLGSSGQDGVSISLGKTDRFSAKWFDLDPNGLVPSGSFLDLSFLGAYGGRPEQCLGSVHIEDVGSSLEITADYTPVGVTSRRLEVVLSNQVVAVVTANTGLVARVPTWPGGCGKLGPRGIYPPLLCIVVNWPNRIPIELGSGNGPLSIVQGDELRILAENAPAPLDYISEFDLRSAGIPNFGIYDETIGRPVLSIVRGPGTQAIISWTPNVGTLQEANDVTGPWINTPNGTNPLIINAGSGRKFYRVRL